MAYFPFFFFFGYRLRRGFRMQFAVAQNGQHARPVFLQDRAASSGRRSGPWTSGTAAGTSARGMSFTCLRSSLLSSSRILSAFIVFSYFRRCRLRGRPSWSGSGSFWAARRIASVAISFDTPSISNRILPGRITATHCSGRAFAFTHTGFSGLLGDRLVREQADPNFAAALDETRHGDTGGFNLPVGDPAAAHGFQTEIAESERSSRARLCRSCGRAAVFCISPSWASTWRKISNNP